MLRFNLQKKKQETAKLNNVAHLFPSLREKWVSVYPLAPLSLSTTVLSDFLAPGVYSQDQKQFDRHSLLFSYFNGYIRAIDLVRASFCITILCSLIKNTA